VIIIKNLTKKFGSKVAVDNISVAIPEGRVIGFLGPNGAGKTTTMNIILGLEKPTAGEVKIDGKNYTELKDPLRVVGAIVGTNFHKNRSLREHLRFLTVVAGIPRNRIDEVLELTGLTDVAKKPVGKFSLGMTQRAGIAAAILGEPKYLILDEPVSGLDPEGIICVREFCKAYAAAGHTVLISSHLMSEVEHTVDGAIIIGRGKIIMTGTLKEILRKTETKTLEAAFIKLTAKEVEFRAGELPKFSEAEGGK